MSNQQSDPETLHQRLKRVNALADGKHLIILRSSNTTLAGMPAEDDVSKIVEGRTQYQFVIEGRPPEPSFMQEGMQISMDTGVQLRDGRYISSSLTQDEAESLWDAIVKSFRPRPHAVKGI